MEMGKRSMEKKNEIVSYMKYVENIGWKYVIWYDKNGKMKKNKMYVRRMFIFEKIEGNER
jgi:magnesium-transporting ATPase (P-type)